MAQLVKSLTLILSSGLGFRTVSSSPALSSMLGVESTLKKKVSILLKKRRKYDPIYYHRIQICP